MMPAPRVLLLLPGHGVEDLPADLEDRDAASLLNAAAVAWHPEVLVRCDAAPQWDRADDPPPVHEGWLVFSPTSAEGLVPEDWLETARERGAIWAEGLVGREDWLAALAGDLAPAPGVAALPRSQDFFALGSAWLQLTRLARRMHIFEDIDADRLFGFAKDAADASLTGDEEKTHEGLKRAFDVLLDFRERLQPLDPSLIDLVLLDDNAGALAACLDTVSPHTPVCLMGGLDVWRPLLDARPDLRVRLDSLGASVDLVMGRDADTATDLDPLHVVAEDLARVRREAKDLLGKPPKVWGRREMALRAQLPQILKQCGYEGALHIGLDVGEFPDEEEARLDWVGPDHTSIPATSRLPIPSSRASSMWMFPDRLGESMEIDYSAAAILLRFPDQQSEWFEDVRRACTYGPVFGRFLTLTEFFADDAGGGRQFRPQMREYLSPELVRRAASAKVAGAKDKVDLHRETEDIAASVVRGLTTIAGGRRSESTLLCVHDFADTIGPGEPAGRVFVNPAPFERTFAVWDEGRDFGPCEAVRFWQSAGGGGTAVVRVPPLGYAFVPRGEPTPSPVGKVHVCEGLLLRNEFMQLEVSERTGGIKALRVYDVRSALLSQQIGYRDEGDDECRTQMVADSVEAIPGSSGPIAATIRSTGRVLSTDSDELLAEFTQTVTVTRGVRAAHVSLQLEPRVRPEGGPWSNYFAVRWAWGDSSAPVSQSSDWDVAVAPRVRLDSPRWIEIGESAPIVIIPEGTRFHVRNGRRTVDSLVWTRGTAAAEKLTFNFSVTAGHPHPAEAALDVACSARTDLVADCARPHVESAWLVNVDAPGVLLLRLEPRTTDDGGTVLTALLRETEGRRRTATFTLCRDVAEATVIDWMDRPTGTLRVDGGKIEVPLRGHDIKRVAIVLQ